jgi:hypothetical protein
MLNLKWLPSQTYAFDATSIETMARDFSQYYGFNHGYHEAIFRATPGNIGGIWPGFWMWSGNSVIFENLLPWKAGVSSEIDIAELRGESPSYIAAAIHEWGTGGFAWMFQGTVAGFDYTTYRKFGMLWRSGGQWTRARCACTWTMSSRAVRLTMVPLNPSDSS